MNKIIYLAIPYTWNPTKSFEIANKIAADLMNEGHIVFSPISHSHPIADYLSPELRINQEFWMKQDLPLLQKCDEVFVVHIGSEGQTLIDESKGVQKELQRAKNLGLSITTYFL